MSADNPQTITVAEATARTIERLAIEHRKYCDGTDECGITLALLAPVVESLRKRKLTEDEWTAFL